MLEIRKIELELGERKLACHDSLRFPMGSISFIKGESGSGKTTLLYVLGMISKQKNYEMYFNGDSMNSQAKREFVRKNEIGMMYQNFNLLEDLSLYQNLKLFAAINSTQLTEQKAKKVLNIVHLQTDLARKFGSLSGGEKQRFSLACILLKNPSVIIADEPTSALDKENANQLMQILFTLARKFQKMIIVSTHSKDYDYMADNIITLYRNNITQTSLLKTDDEYIEKRENRKLSLSFYLDMSKVRILRLIRKSSLISLLLIIMLALSVFLFNYSKNSQEEYTHYLNTGLQSEVFMIPKGYDSQLTEEKLSKLLLVPTIDGIYPIDAMNGNLGEVGLVEIYPIYPFQNKLKKKSCMVDSSLYNYLGQTIEIDLYGGQIELIVEEIYPTDKTDLYSKNGIGKVFIPIEYIEHLYNINVPSKYVMEISNFYDYDNIVQKVSAISSDYELYSSYHYFSNLLLNAKRQQIYIHLSSIVLALISFVLFVTMQIHEVKDKQKEMCIFQANGLNKKHVFQLELIENLFRTVLIFVLGVLLSFLFVSIANNYLLEVIAMRVNRSYILVLAGSLFITIILPSLCTAFYIILQSPEDELRGFF